MTKTEEEGTIIINRPDRSTYPEEKSVLRSGATPSYAQGINARGQVAGYSQITIADATEHAFISAPHGGALTDLGTLGGRNSIAIAINASGQVVGASNPAGSTAWHAFISAPHMHNRLDAERFEDCDEHSRRGRPYGSFGEGSDRASDREEARFAQSAVLVDLGTLGGPNSVANGVNDCADVAGYAINGSGVQVGFVDLDGTMYDLNTLLEPGAAATLTAAHITIDTATGINNDGLISANGVDSQGLSHAYLLRRLPPASQRETHKHK